MSDRMSSEVDQSHVAAPTVRRKKLPTSSASGKKSASAASLESNLGSTESSYCIFTVDTLPPLW